MLNRYQVSFLLSFIVTFAALFGVSRFVGAQLKAAGYDISRLILVGLPEKGKYTDAPNPYLNPPPMPDTASAPFDLAAWANGYAPVVALVAASITFVVFYIKLGDKARKPVLDPKVWKEFPLKEKIIISPNTAIYRFALPHPQDVLGLPIGQHISVSAEIDGKDIMRSYTPTSSDDDRGHFDLLIKSYEKGNISRYVSLLKIGDKVRVKGPKGQFNYHSSLSQELGMIAGGTGITPMLQIIRAALKNPLDRTKLSLIYANVNAEDILLKSELDSLAASHPHRFRLFYVLNNPPPAWNGGVGFVGKEQIQAHLPPTDHNIKVLMCGPPPMMTAMKKHLDELGYPAPRTVSKLVDQVFLF